MFNWKKSLDDFIGHFPHTEDAYLFLRPYFIIKRYRARREKYEKYCRLNNLVYSERNSIDLLRNKLAKRGYSIPKRKVGETHTFAFIPKISWHENLYDDLGILGPLTIFDYESIGFKHGDFISARNRNELRKKMNSQFFEAVKVAHKKRSIDWVFVYASGTHIRAETISKIQELFGIPTVNMCLDDKQSWEGTKYNDHRGGQIDIAPVFDLSWSSSRTTCQWYLARGGIPIYLPEGCNIKVYHPVPVERDIHVSYVGTKYGFRASVIRFLKKYGVEVETYGTGWKNRGVWGEEAVKIICRSKINLGMGGIGASEDLTNVKTRDFEIPACEGGVYITTFNPDLALHYQIGKEIVCYRNRDEMLELIRYYLNHPDEGREIATAGRARCLKEHRWIHRYIKVCQVLGILDDSLLSAELVNQQIEQTFHIESTEEVNDEAA